MGCGCQDTNKNKDCCQLLSLNDTTGDLLIGPYGNTINICGSVKFCETDTILYNTRLVGNILEITYIGESGVPQVKTVDFTPILIPGEPGIVNVTDTDSIDLTLIGDTLSADLRIDAASTAPVSVSAAGVRIDCCPETIITVNDSNTIDLVTSGSVNHTLTASLKYADSDTIDFSDSGSGFTGAVKLDPDPNQLITSTVNGLLVDSSDILTLVSATSPLSYDNLTGIISISEADTATDGYINSTDWNTFNDKVNDGTNLGTGAEVFAQKNGINLEFRTLTQGSNITITETATEIEISSSAGANPLVDYLADVSDFAAYSGTAESIIVGSNENIYLKYLGSETPDGYFIVTDSTAQEWKVSNIDFVTFIADSTYSLTGDKVLDKVIVTPSSNLAGFKIGTSLGADDIVPTVSVTGGVSTVFNLGVYADGSDLTLNIGGITSNTVIKFYKT